MTPTPTDDALRATQVVRVEPCPDCYRMCGWCSWYAKNARRAGCCPVYGRKKCEWAEQLKGTTCPTCGGTESVRLVGRYERVEVANG